MKDQAKINFLTVMAFLLTFVALRAFAQDVIVEPSADELTKYLAVLASIGSLKGFALAAAVIQGLMLFFRSSLSAFAGKFKFLIIAGLSFVAAMVGGLAAGKSIGQVLLDGAVLSALQVFAHQAIKQFGEKQV